ncbi:MAG: hypothetical protein CMQ44_06300 [Gammaproteobacteria bacterium]|nr:hypothetical protein [Gammaproteobacteria bacterium]|tara:strand:- start:4741 stop:5712 length:972 start_codon:yes stop_codon:yes gene_type:complete
MSFNQAFSPPPGLTNPHVQTILSSVGRKVMVPQSVKAFLDAATEHVIEVAGVRLVVHRNTQANNPDAPLIMIVPGWLGNSRSSYVVSAALQLWRQGFNVARINLRDHGDTAHLNSGLFHSALIEEVIELARYLMTDGQPERNDLRHCGLIGYSLGGNFALRLARAIPELTTLAICPAIDPYATMRQIESSIIYRNYFIIKWRKLFREKQRHFPTLYDFGPAMKLSSVASLTDYFIKYHSEFDDTASYCAAYDLSDSALTGVSAHIVAAADDPIIPAHFYERLPETITVDLIDRGGHGAFLENWQLDSWVDRYSCRFFSQRLKN